MNHPVKTLVVGSRFGQFYAAGVAAAEHLELVGVLGQGSPRSQALARHLRVPCFTALEQIPDDTRLACVAVGGAARGEQGPALAQALMARGLDVLIEHPLLPQELQALLRTAARLQRRCLLNSFYPQLPWVARFIELGRQLHQRQGIRHIEASCAVQVSFATLDVLAALLEAVAPWSLDDLAAGLSPWRDLSLVMAEVPVSLRVLNELAAADDGRMQMLQRISLATDSGTLLLASPHGPLLWMPAVRAPGEDAHGLFALGGAGLPCVEVLLDAASDWGQVYREIWPRAATSALQPLLDGAGLARRQQRSLEVVGLWQQVTAAIGFPEAPTQSLPAATLAQALEGAA
ncbi:MULTISPECIES: Gfo/Idh/MocA family oxidoreductase [unclassified Pseudomonas]|uniref:Gfo/Idh/MocA family oxidoreductase n=1 Tax=unclassified Pseudomonas TaxID=196821 RepID=UPI00244AA46B|nr:MULTISPECIES: Gfo/Idh/MocA family oxidoreductase [unclassified Pseudomonas]MDH0303284.1 Gfo/Idh/MocA family oxidoreductase [Pseudomonas sp. GD04091]MDH1985308.1 Gfo/Idh/MocA family oxidoreductase [Pseudomonas sp. GD03689]